MKKIKDTTVYEGNWLSVHELIYTNKQGQELIWETVNRKRSKIGVVVVAQLVPSKRFIIIKQYRPAVDGYVLSFPAGLGAEDPNHGLVELKEETGYKGKIVSISPVLKAGAGLVNDSARVLFVEVDENLPENQNPQQELEPAEDIEVCLIHSENVLKFIEAEQAKGTHIAVNLWYMFGLRHFIK